MKKIISTLVFITLIAAGYFFYKSGDKELKNLIEVERVTFVESNMGFTFDYPSGPSGYVLDERMPVDLGKHIKTIILMRTEDVQNPPPAGGEGPPVITISVFENPDNQSPRIWAENNTQYTNINLLMGKVDDVVVSGEKAIHYMADGLYSSDNIVVSHGQNIYAITGQFMNPDSEIRRDFKSLIESISFISQSGQN